MRWSSWSGGQRTVSGRPSGPRGSRRCCCGISRCRFGPLQDLRALREMRAALRDFRARPRRRALREGGCHRTDGGTAAWASRLWSRRTAGPSRPGCRRVARRGVSLDRAVHQSLCRGHDHHGLGVRPAARPPGRRPAGAPPGDGAQRHARRAPGHCGRVPDREPPRLVMVARFGPQKDHPTLLRALAGLRDHPWELDLVGEGPLWPQTAGSRLVVSGIADRVHFLGQRMDVDRILAAAQVEPAGDELGGLPVEHSRSDARGRCRWWPRRSVALARRVRDGETGYLVPPGRWQPLRERIRQLLVDPGLRVRLGAQGRTVYEEQFTLDQTGRRRSRSTATCSSRDSTAVGASGRSGPDGRPHDAERASWIAPDTAASSSTLTHPFGQPQPWPTGSASCS